MDRPVTKWQTLANGYKNDPAHVRSRTVQPIGKNFKTGPYFKNVPRIIEYIIILIIITFSLMNNLVSGMHHQQTLHPIS